LKTAVVNDAAGQKWPLFIAKFLLGKEYKARDMMRNYRPMNKNLFLIHNKTEE